MLHRYIVLLCLTLTIGCGKKETTNAPASDGKADPKTMPKPEPKIVYAEEELPGAINDLKKLKPETRIKGVEKVVALAIEGVDVVPPLLDALKDTGASDVGISGLDIDNPVRSVPHSTREAVVLTFLKLAGAGQAVPYEKITLGLRDGLKNTDPKVLEHTIYAVALLGKQGLPLQADLLRHLASPEAEVRSAAYSALGSLGFADPKPILALVEHRAYGVRRAALMSLSEFDLTKDAVPTLRSALKNSENRAERTTILRLLAKLGPEAADAVPDLVELLSTFTEKDLKNFERFNNFPILTVFRDIGAPAVPALAAILNDPDKPVARYLALHALGMIGKPAASALPQITPLLKEPPGSISLQAAHALICLGGEPGPAFEVIRKVMATQPTNPMDDDEVELAAMRRFEALRVVSQLGESAADLFPEILNRLEDDQAFVVQMAVYALQQLGPKGVEAVPELAKLAQDPSSRLRTSILRFFKELGPKAKAARPTLERLLKDRDAQVRKLSFEALAALRLPAADILPTVAGQLKNDESMQFTALDTIASYGPEAAGVIEELREYAKTLGGNRDLTISWAKTVASLGSAAAPAIPELLTLAKTSRDEEVRYAAIGALGAIGPKASSAVELLEGNLKRKPLDLRGVWSASALAAITQKTEPYLELVVAGLRDPKARPQTRLSILDALPLFGAGLKEIRNDLVKFATSEKSEERRQVIAALVALSVGEKKPDPALVKLADDENREVRAEARRHLRRLGWSPTKREE